MRCKMKTIKKIFKKVVYSYIDGYKETANVMYGHLYNN